LVKKERKKERKKESEKLTMHQRSVAPKRATAADARPLAAMRKNKK
jgi:hypothetical protein